MAGEMTAVLRIVVMMKTAMTIVTRAMVMTVTVAAEVATKIAIQTSRIIKVTYSMMKIILKQIIIPSLKNI